MKNIKKYDDFVNESNNPMDYNKELIYYIFKNGIVDSSLNLAFKARVVGGDLDEWDYNDKPTKDNFELYYEYVKENPDLFEIWLEGRWEDFQKEFEELEDVDVYSFAEELEEYLDDPKVKEIFKKKFEEKIREEN